MPTNDSAKSNSNPVKPSPRTGSVQPQLSARSIVSSSSSRSLASDSLSRTHSNSAPLSARSINSNHAAEVMRFEEALEQIVPDDPNIAADAIDKELFEKFMLSEDLGHNDHQHDNHAHQHHHDEHDNPRDAAQPHSELEDGYADSDFDEFAEFAEYSPSPFACNWFLFLMKVPRR